MTKKRGDILIVDDDPGMGRLLSIRLESEGYSVRTAEDGEAAMAEAAKSRPDIVVSDLRMEPVDGMALLQRLQESLPGLPVIMMTAYGTIPDAVEATRRGAYGFVTKPIDKDELFLILDHTETARGPHHQENPLIERIASAAIARRSAPFV